MAIVRFRPSSRRTSVLHNRRWQISSEQIRLDYRDTFDKYRPNQVRRYRFLLRAEIYRDTALVESLQVHVWYVMNII